MNDREKIFDPIIPKVDLELITRNDYYNEIYIKAALIQDRVENYRNRVLVRYARWIEGAKILEGIREQDKLQAEHGWTK